jgi:hypothetical protein
MFNKMKDKFQSLKEFYYRKAAARRLIGRYEYLIEVDKILEEYITSKILQGGSQEFITKSRTELVQKQNEIRETKKMVDFLKSIK